MHGNLPSRSSPSPNNTEIQDLVALSSLCQFPNQIHSRGFRFWRDVDSSMGAPKKTKKGDVPNSPITKSERASTLKRRGSGKLAKTTSKMVRKFGIPEAWTPENATRHLNQKVLALASAVDGDGDKHGSSGENDRGLPEYVEYMESCLKIVGCAVNFVLENGMAIDWCQDVLQTVADTSDKIQAIPSVRALDSLESICSNFGGVLVIGDPSDVGNTASFDISDAQTLLQITWQDSSLSHHPPPSPWLYLKAVHDAAQRNLDHYPSPRGWALLDLAILLRAILELMFLPQELTVESST